jgi:hypothetical protein
MTRARRARDWCKKRLIPGVVLLEHLVRREEWEAMNLATSRICLAAVMAVTALVTASGASADTADRVSVVKADAALVDYRWGSDSPTAWMSISAVEGQIRFDGEPRKAKLPTRELVTVWAAGKAACDPDPAVRTLTVRELQGSVLTVDQSSGGIAMFDGKRAVLNGTIPLHVHFSEWRLREDLPEILACAIDEVPYSEAWDLYFELISNVSTTTVVDFDLNGTWTKTGGKRRSALSVAASFSIDLDGDGVSEEPGQTVPDDPFLGRLSNTTVAYYPG